MMFWGWNWGWGGLGSFLWVIFVAAVALVPWLFFLMNLRGLLEKVSPPNRAMPPEQVWLNFIPVFNLGWFIYTVAKVRDSVKAEYDSRGWPPEDDFGYNVGLAAGILGICSAVFGWIPVIGWGVGVAALICWIIYWLKTADLRNRLSFGDQWHGAGTPPPYADYRPPYGQPPASTPGAYPPYYPAPHPGGEQQQPPVVRPAPPQSASEQQPAGERPVAVQQTPVQDSGVGSTEAAPKRTTNKQCAVCDTTVAPDDKFCRGCGLPLP